MHLNSGVYIVEIVAGLAIILDKYGALLALILMSISVNAVLFHAVLDPGGIGGAALGPDEEPVRHHRPLLLSFAQRST